jgi:hypothetical protein
MNQLLDWMLALCDCELRYEGRSNHFSDARCNSAASKDVQKN